MVWKSEICTAAMLAAGAYLSVAAVEGIAGAAAGSCCAEALNSAAMPVAAIEK
jgi:hypothetical protein